MNQKYCENIKRVEGLLNGSVDCETLPVIPQSAVANNAGNKFVVVDGVMYAINEQYTKSIEKIIANANMPTFQNNEESIVAPSLVCEQ